MLKIGIRQLEAISHQRMADFVERTAHDIQHLYETELARAGHGPDHTQAAVTTWVRRGRQRGFLTEQEMRTYIDACILLGEKEMARPGDSALSRILDDTQLSGRVKADYLFEYLVFAAQRTEARQ